MIPNVLPSTENVTGTFFGLPAFWWWIIVLIVEIVIICLFFVTAFRLTPLIRYNTKIKDHHKV